LICALQSPKAVIARSGNDETISRLPRLRLAMTSDRATPKTIPTLLRHPTPSRDRDGIGKGRPTTRRGDPDAWGRSPIGRALFTVPSSENYPNLYHPEDEGIVTGALNRPGFALALADFERGFSDRATPKTIPSSSSPLP